MAGKQRSWGAHGARQDRNGRDRQAVNSLRYDKKKPLLGRRGFADDGSGFEARRGHGQFRYRGTKHADSSERRKPRRLPQQESFKKSAKPVSTFVGDGGVLRHQSIPFAHSDAVTAICVALDSVYTASWDGILKRWKPERALDGKALLVQEAQVELGCACWSMVCFDDWILCGLSNGAIRAFSKAGVDLTMSKHTEGVSSMLVHEHVVLTGSADGTVRCWTLDESNTFQNVYTVAEMIPDQVRCLAVLEGQLWVGTGLGVTVLELPSLSRAVDLQPKLKVMGLVAHQGHMITAYVDGSIRIFDNCGKIKHTQDAFSGGTVCGISSLGCGTRVICTHARGDITSISLPAFELSCSWRALDNCRIRSVCAASQQGFFFVGGDNGEVQVWQQHETLVRKQQPVPHSRDSAGEPKSNGAPRCRSGHVCAPSSYAEGAYGNGFKCEVCGIQCKAERWFCNVCQDDFCYRCFPKCDASDTAGGKRDADQRDAQMLFGRWVQVRQHSTMGSAVVTFKNVQHRDVILARFSNDALVLGGIRMELKPHMERQADGSRAEIPDCAFIGWKQPKGDGVCKISAKTLQRHLDWLCARECPVITLDE